VAVLVAPLQIGSNSLAGQNSSAPLLRPPVPTAERRIEADYITRSRQFRTGSQGGLLVQLEEAVEPTAGTYHRNYPDTIRPERKEVTPVEPSGRRPDAI
jgi:hypothetical protein